MQVVITGGCGFLGRRLAQRLLDDPAAAGLSAPLTRLTLFDTVAPERPVSDDPRLSVVTGDIADAASVTALLAEADSVFHLAAVVSAGAEADYDLGYRVNLDGTRNVIEGCRASGRVPRLVFASSIAAYGGALPECVEDATPVRPQTSYGVQKVMGELMINDATRKGFLDGRAMRLPTIVVRPGKPNKAASGFASGIIREPLSGVDFDCPVTPESAMAIMSPRTVTRCFTHLHALDGADIGADRCVMLTGFRVSMAEAKASLERVATNRRTGEIRFAVDPHIQSIVDGWPRESRSARAADLGFPHDSSMDEIIREHIEDELEGTAA